jgi:hypothetical protein
LSPALGAIEVDPVVAVRAKLVLADGATNREIARCL